MTDTRAPETAPAVRLSVIFGLEWTPNDRAHNWLETDRGGASARPSGAHALGLARGAGRWHSARARRLVAALRLGRVRRRGAHRHRVAGRARRRDQLDADQHGVAACGAEETTRRTRPDHASLLRAQL